MGKIGSSSAGGKIIISGLSPENIRYGKAVTIKRGNKIISSETGNFVADTSLFMVSVGNTQKHQESIGDVVQENPETNNFVSILMIDHGLKYTFTPGKFRIFFNGISSTPTISWLETDIPDATAGKWISFTSTGNSYISFIRQGHGGTLVHTLIAYKEA